MLPPRLNSPAGDGSAEISAGTLDALVNSLTAAAQLAYHENCDLAAVQGRLADGFRGLPPEAQVGVLWSFARLLWRGDAVARCVEQAAQPGSALLSARAVPEAPRLAWALARLDCRGRNVLHLCRTLAANALPQVDAFEPSEVAKMAAALCRLGAFEEVWHLYARMQRAMVGTAGVPQLRGIMLSASEKKGDAARSLAVLSHLAIIPRVACSPTWRAALAGAAVIMLWRVAGARAAAEGRRRLALVGMKNNHVARAIERRFDEFLADPDAGASRGAPPAGGSEVAPAVQRLCDALRSGPKDMAADRRKEFVLLRHLSMQASPWDAGLLLQYLEAFANQRTFLKIAGGVKRRVLERVAAEAPPGLVVELGSYVGYSAVVLALARDASAPPGAPSGGPSPSVVTTELDPVNAIVARNIVGLAGLTAKIEVWIENSSDVARHILDRFGPRSVAMLFMDHRGSVFHEDLQCFEALGLLKPGARIVADNVLKPGAPMFLWLVSQSSAFAANFIALPEFGLGHQALEDWMAVCEYIAAPDDPGAPLPPPNKRPPCPGEIVALAEYCDQIRVRSVLREGVGVAEWGTHAAAVKAALHKFGIKATLTDGEVGLAEAAVGPSPAGAAEEVAAG